jgi:uncharacterized protein YdaU (DUF1376 family)
MYPKDFDTDENVRMLDLTETGLFVLCLNHAWINDGLPADPEDIARALKIPNLSKIWPRVSKCFYPDGDRLRNKRQEEERSVAVAKSENNSRSARTPRERKSNAERTLSERKSNAERTQIERKSNAERTLSERKSNAERTLSERLSFDVQHARARAGSGSGSGFVSEVSEDFSERFSIAWSRHRKNRREETRDLVAQILIGNGVDWDVFDRAHVGYCEYWARHGWHVCPVSMLEWWRNGMPEAPQEPSANGKEKPERRPNYRLGEGIDE